MIVAGPGNSLSLFIGLADYPDPADNGYLWYYLADIKSEAGMAQLSANLASHFPNVEASRLRTLAPGEVGSLN